MGREAFQKDLIGKKAVLKKGSDGVGGKGVVAGKGVGKGVGKGEGTGKGKGKGKGKGVSKGMGDEDAGASAGADVSGGLLDKVSYKSSLQLHTYIC